MSIAGRRPRLLPALLLVFLWPLACGTGDAPPKGFPGGGRPERGRAALQRYGCGSCHTIPGVRGADALVGPPLTQIAARAYVAGVLPNTPENMIRWIRDPRAVDTLTAMPDLHVSEEDARDIVSYLYSRK